MSGLGTTIITFGGKAPRIHDTAFVAPGARIIGDVEIGPDASVWYNCVLRGDINRIVLGARSNLQDGSIIHVEGPTEEGAGLPTIIGEDALIGHGALLHGCTIEDRAFVGMAAIVMDGARVESQGMLAAGALLTPGRTVPTHEIWSGRPARPFRKLTGEMLEDMAAQTAHYMDMARQHAAALQGAARCGTQGRAL